MKTTYTTRFAALIVAVLTSVAINGAVLSGFDAVAQAGAVANSGQTPTVVTLKTVSMGVAKMDATLRSRCETAVINQPAPLQRVSCS